MHGLWWRTVHVPNPRRLDHLQGLNLTTANADLLKLGPRLNYSMEADTCLAELCLNSIAILLHHN